VYLHPKGTVLTIADTKFKNRYLVRSIVNWGKGSQRHHHDMGSMNMDGQSAPKLTIGMTDEVNSLIDIHKKSLWVVSIAVTELEKQPAQKVEGALAITLSNR